MLRLWTNDLILCILNKSLRSLECKIKQKVFYYKSNTRKTSIYALNLHKRKKNVALNVKNDKLCLYNIVN